MNEDSRLTRFLDWLRDLPTLAGLWLLDRVAGPYPERRRIEFENDARSGCVGHSRMSMLTGPDDTRADAD